MFLLISLFVFGFIKTQPAFANISLDTTYGSNGTVTTSFGNNAIPSRIAIQPDGKTVVAGYASNGSINGWAIARYNTNGTLDTAFGNNGIVTKFFDANSALNAITIQSDGKIVVGGYSNDTPSDCSPFHNSCWTVARYNTDGTLDTTFGTGGIVYSDVRDGTDNEAVSALTIQPDGKIIAVGNAYDLGVVRYNTDGSTDFNDLIEIPNSTSAPPAIFPNPVGGGELYATGTAVTIEQRGDILIAGFAGNNRIFTLSLASSNSFDASYGDGGLFETGVQTNNNVNDMVLEPNSESILVGLACSDSCYSSFNTFLAEVTTAGTLDTTFGNSGIELTNFSAGSNGGETVLIEPVDNKILVGGFLNGNYASYRFNTNGSLDTTFGTNGVFTTSIEQGGIVSDITLQSNNELVAVGSTSNGSYNDWGLFRTTAIISAEAPPVTTATLSPSPYADGTYQDPTTVTLSATAASGYTIADTYYTIDGGSQQTYSSPITVTGSGNHTITYWSVDNQGVTETTNTQTFTITEAYALSGTVFTDSNHDGVQDNGEQGYQGATVTVSQDNQAVDTATSGSNGNYSFPSLEAGNYSVVVTLPSGDIATTSNPDSVALTANTTVNFGIAQATTTLSPTQDSFIEHDGQNANNGASTVLELSYEGKDRALVEFNQTQIQAAIGNDPNFTASLVMTLISVNSNWGTGRQIDVDRLNHTWVEGNGTWFQNGYRGTGSGVTWNCSVDSDITNDSVNCSGSTAWDMLDQSSWPFVATPTTTAVITNNETGTVSFNVTSDVQAFLNGTANNGWIIRKDDETKEGDLQFASRESSHIPQLVITDH